MYVKRRSVSALYRLFLGILALISLIIELSTFGIAAWRLFAPWVMLAIIIYFLISAVITAFYKRRSPGRMLSPMLQGALAIASATLIIGFIMILSGKTGIPSLTGFAGVLVYFLVPLLVILDWLVFCKKGQWRVSEPFYWLSFFVVYACGILLTASLSARALIMQYPYEFLNYHIIGIDTMLWWGVLFIVLILAGSYVLVGLDTIWSGKLSKFIVMPRIKTIVIEEIVEEVEDQPEPAQPITKIASKPTSPKSLKIKQSSTQKKSQPEIKSQKSAQGQKAMQPQLRNKKHYANQTKNRKINSEFKKSVSKTKNSPDKNN